MSTPDRRGPLDPSHESLSVRRQCELVGVARSGVYRAKPPAGDADLAVMKRLDQLFTARPFYGSRRMLLQLRQEGHEINRKRVQRLMRRMDGACQGPAERSSGGWQAEGSRAVLSWRLSNTMDASFRVAALDDALARHGRRPPASPTGCARRSLKPASPGTFNTDQGSQLTGRDFTGRLEQAGIGISMDGRGRWMDKVSIERPRSTPR